MINAAMWNQQQQQNQQQQMVQQQQQQQQQTMQQQQQRQPQPVQSQSQSAGPLLLPSSTFTANAPNVFLPSSYSPSSFPPSSFPSLPMGVQSASVQSNPQSSAFGLAPLSFITPAAFSPQFTAGGGMTIMHSNNNNANNNAILGGAGGMMMATNAQQQQQQQQQHQQHHLQQSQQHQHHMQSIQQAYLARQQYDMLQQQSQQLQQQAQQLLQQSLGNGTWLMSAPQQPTQTQVQQTQPSMFADPSSMFLSAQSQQMQPQQQQQHLFMAPQQSGPFMLGPSPLLSAPLSVGVGGLMPPLKTMLPPLPLPTLTPIPTLASIQMQPIMAHKAISVPATAVESATALTTLGTASRMQRSAPAELASAVTATVATVSLNHLVSAAESAVPATASPARGRDSPPPRSSQHRKRKGAVPEQERDESESDSEDALHPHPSVPSRRPSLTVKARKPVGPSLPSKKPRRDDAEDADEDGQEHGFASDVEEDAQASDDERSPAPSTPSSASSRHSAASLLNRSELACGSIRTAPGTKMHKFRSVIRCGVTDRHGHMLPSMTLPYFGGREMDVYSADVDPKRRPLVRASTLADKFNCATNKVGMYLARRRTVFDGIYQATEFANKPNGKTGLKIGGYFLTLDACLDFERHYHVHKSKKSNVPLYMHTADITPVIAIAAATSSGLGGHGASSSHKHKRREKEQQRREVVRSHVDDDDGEDAEVADEEEEEPQAVVVAGPSLPSKRKLASSLSQVAEALQVMGPTLPPGGEFTIAAPGSSEAEEAPSTSASASASTTTTPVRVRVPSRTTKPEQSTLASVAAAAAAASVELHEEEVKRADSAEMMVKVPSVAHALTTLGPHTKLDQTSLAARVHGPELPAPSGLTTPTSKMIALRPAVTALPSSLLRPLLPLPRAISPAPTAAAPSPAGVSSC